MYNGYQMINGRKQKDGFICSPGTGSRHSRACVAVKIGNEKVLVRDTKDLTDKTLTFNFQEWEVFTDAIKCGEFSV